MRPPPTTLLRLLPLAALAIALPLNADILETINGARLVGNITKIEHGSITLATIYAGNLTISADKITRIETDSPLNIRLADNRVLSGRLLSPEDGKIEIKDAATSRQAPPLATIAQVWAVGQPDPEIEARKRKWTYEIAFDISGKNGTSDQLGSALAVNARLAGPRDTLRLYAGYNRLLTDGTTSTDQGRAGADYSNSVAPNSKWNWYARDEIGYDHIKDINFYNLAAAGIGYNLIQRKLHILTFRLGLSHRYEKYHADETPELNDFGLDIGINHEWTFYNSRIVTRVNYNPIITSLGKYTARHESYYEIPLGKSDWRFRAGITNDYNSDPVPGIDKLDTTYFTRLVLIWH